MGILPGFALSLGSSLATGALNNRYAQENAAAQREWLEAMWSRENAYNTPAAMSHRMREAGLNPYTMTGAQPAGSVGTGAQAQTIPFDNPIANLTQVAQVENLASSTDKNLNESDRILLQIERDKVALDMELISKEEYAFRFKKYQEAYKELNPFTLEAKKTQSEIDINESQTDLNFTTALQNLNNIDISKERLSLEQQKVYFEGLRTASDIALNESEQHNIETDTQVKHFYNEFIQPLEYEQKRIGNFIEKNKLEGTRLENQYQRLLNTHQELQNKLATGDASGFVTYANYYLHDIIGLSNAGSNVAKVFVK